VPTEGEARLTINFEILLKLLTLILESIKTMMQASLSRLMVATSQVRAKYDMRANNKES
jgi:hypothetical protein